MEILLIDVGNTTINIATYRDDKLLKNFKLNTDTSKTSDEYYLDLNKFYDLTNIKDVVIASVVPYITNELVTLFKNHLNIDPILLQPKTKTGVNIIADNPREVGADLIAGAASLDNKSYLIIDLGTATKYIYVKNKTILGVVITPGVEISIKALVGKTALLPNIDIYVPKKVLGNNTTECMQSGVTYGAAAQIDGLIELIKDEVKDDFKVLITGGLAPLIKPLIKHEVLCNPNLIFEGLLKIYHLNRQEIKRWLKQEEVNI